MLLFKAITKFLLLILALTIELLMFKPIYCQGGSVNWFLVWILIGLPFGIRKMFVLFVPHGFDLGGTLGVVGLNIIVGGLIGGAVVIIHIVKCLADIVRSICLMAC